MFSANHTFLFASLGSKRPRTARKVHIRRLYDVLQLSLQRSDLLRARRAWVILARCKEIHWMSLWTTAVQILGKGIDEGENNSQRPEFLRAIMLQHPDDREAIIKELVLRLILSGRHEEALGELELYLPSFPYQDNPVLHVYAGMISLYLAQPSIADDAASFKCSLLRDAQSYFEHAKTLDPNNVVAQAFLEKIPTLSRSPHVQADLDSEDDNMDIDDKNQRLKRVRT